MYIRYVFCAHSNKLRKATPIYIEIPVGHAGNMTAILAFGRLMEEDHEFEASLRYTGS